MKQQTFGFPAGLVRGTSKLVLKRRFCFAGDNIPSCRPKSSFKWESSLFCELFGQKL